MIRGLPELLWVKQLKCFDKLIRHQDCDGARSEGVAPLEQFQQKLQTFALAKLRKNKESKSSKCGVTNRCLSARHMLASNAIGDASMIHGLPELL